MTELQTRKTAEKSRPARKPFGGLEQKLYYPPRDGFHRHWFNDVGNRISRAQEAGYSHVTGTDEKPVTKVVGTLESGQPMSAFLMEIPEEWYKEDMNAQLAEVSKREEAIRRGDLGKQEGDGRYVPQQGISIKSGK